MIVSEHQGRVTWTQTQSHVELRLTKHWQPEFNLKFTQSENLSYSLAGGSCLRNASEHQDDTDHDSGGWIPSPNAVTSTSDSPAGGSDCSGPESRFKSDPGFSKVSHLNGHLSAKVHCPHRAGANSGCSRLFAWGSPGPALPGPDLHCDCH